MARASRSGQRINQSAASKAVEHSRQRAMAHPVDLHEEVRHLSEKAGGIHQLKKLTDVLRCRGR
jgi:hypothetical protein